MRYDPEFKLDPETLNYSVMGPSAATVAQDIHRAFAKDIEGKMQAALVALGWCPPKEAADAMGALASAIDAAVRKGVAVNWEPLTAELVRAHDAIAKLK